MSEIDWSILLKQSAASTVSSISLALLVGFVLALLLKWHFTHFASTFSNRREFSIIFPFLVLTVTLVIAIVKTSLALSLGLVGALSIVRFRTPIKEPEELAYIFMAIAIGIGLGADQVVMTIVATIIILVLMAVLRLRHQTTAQNLYLSITSEGTEPAIDVQTLSDAIASAVDECELRRVDAQESTTQIVYYVAARDVEQIYQLLARLRSDYSGASISLIDQHRVPGV